MTRTTGYRSQSHRIHGGCSDIAEQIDEPKALVYAVLCLEAAHEGIIPFHVVMGVAVPEHESLWTSKQAADFDVLIDKRIAMLVQQYRRPFYRHEYLADGTIAKVWTRP